MEHTTHAIDITALEAEVDALLAQDAAQAERIEALLATGSTALRMADLAHRMEQGARELAVQERYQRRIARAMDAL